MAADTQTSLQRQTRRLRRQHALLLACLVFPAQLLNWTLGQGAARNGPARVARHAETDIVVSRKVPIIPRPQKGPRPIMELPYHQRPHVPDGADRRPGPVRGLVLKGSLVDTLDSGVDENQRGGLKGRYAEEIAEHLAFRRSLVAQGIRENITVLWDHDNFELPEVYELRPLAALNRYCAWIAGLLNATVTRIETVQFTRYSAPPTWEYIKGVQNLFVSLRQFGGVVHRAWPPMTDRTDSIFFERFRHHLDLMANGGPRSILCLMSEEKGYQAMIEAAQSEGVTVVRIGKNGLITYYPGAHDFSVPVFWERWRLAQEQLFDFKLDPFRPAGEWRPEEGPKKWHDGPVQLEPYGPEEELDRRVFHDFVDKKMYEVKGSLALGTWSRPGYRLNDTLRMAFDRASSKALAKEKKHVPFNTGARFFNEDLERLMEVGPEATQAAREDLESLGQDKE
ncbi:unnamed protein product, partial [Effrenium voratum]